LFNTLPADALVKSAHDRIRSFPNLRLAELIYADERLPLADFARGLRRQYLIIIEDDGDWLCPAFQFNKRGKPLDVVKQVNKMLGADQDPWGAAGWWYSSNGRIGARTPLSLLEEDPQRLLQLARALLEPIG